MQICVKSYLKVTLTKHCSMYFCTGRPSINAAVIYFESNVHYFSSSSANCNLEVVCCMSPFRFACRVLRHRIKTTST